jgi:3-oxoacyl-(acyl-carrier-protein) synthase
VRSPDPLTITGRGVVCAAGAGVEAFAAAPARPTTLSDLPPELRAGLPVGFGGRVGDDLVGDDPAQRAVRLGGLAVEEALREADLDPSQRRVGLVLASALAGTERAELAAADEAPTADALRALAPPALTRELCQPRGLLAGPALSVTCASGLYALEQAALDLALGRLDAVVALGLETLSRYVLAGFCALEALSTSADPDQPSPTDGIVLGEAACAVVLEGAGAARPLARIVGRGLGADATHVTSPAADGRGMTAAIQAALTDAGLPAAAVGRISLTAVGSPAYQAMYEAALAPRLPDWRQRAGSWEPAVGHLLAASTPAGLVDATLALARDPAPVLALTVGFGGLNGATLVVPA